MCTFIAMNNYYERHVLIVYTMYLTRAFPSAYVHVRSRKIYVHVISIYYVIGLKTKTIQFFTPLDEILLYFGCIQFFVVSVQVYNDVTSTRIRYTYDAKKQWQYTYYCDASREICIIKTRIRPNKNSESTLFFGFELSSRFTE